MEEARIAKEAAAAKEAADKAAAEIAAREGADLDKKENALAA